MTQVSRLTRLQVVRGLSRGELELSLGVWGDGSRGVGLYYTGDRMPIERIAVQSWHVDQPDDTLIFADEEADPVWFVEIFGAGSLTSQARELLVDHCRAHEAAIIAWCNGDESAKLPPLQLAHS